MNNIAIISARSGSKGLKDKNIKEINGIPLMSYSILAAIKSRMFSEIMVSTDSKKYAEIAKHYGANVPFLRSIATSTDDASSWDVVKEVLNNYYNLGKKFDTVCLLQPTSPLRTFDDIIGGYNLLSEKNASAITSVCEVDHSPLWTLILPSNCSLKEYRNTSIDSPRQKLDTYYRINGALYIRKINYLLNDITLLDNEEFAFVMSKNHSVDIDDEIDFALAEVLINKGFEYEQK